ncbi:FG-GAP-like repeat-containing protein, partial [Bacteroidota bacterium]
VFDLGDYDSDGDLDILISGQMDNGMPATYIMKNRVINRYQDDYYNEFETAPLDSVMNSSLAWGDYDNDGDLDILLCGEKADATLITKLLNNMGNELFVDVNLDLLEGVKDGFVAWGDVENDGDLDLIFTGSTGVGYVSKFIESNMGNEVNTTPQPPLNLSFQHDGYGKVTLTWDRSIDEETATDALNYNIRLGTTSTGNELSVIHAESDGTRILPAIGKANANTWELNLEPGTYYWSVQSIDGNKQGSGFSTENSITLDYEWMNLNMRGIVDKTIQGETEGELEWADYDGDGDLDLAVIGNDNSRIYENRLDYFVEIWSGGKYGKGDLAWGDYDNDGDLDLVIAGDQSNRNPRTVVLKNDNGYFYEANGEFNFMNEFNPNFYDFEGIYDGNISWMDYDNDGDLDLVLAGLNGANQSILKMYEFERDTNNFDMINVYEISTELPPVQNGGFTFGDYDNDEDLDLAFMGFSGMTGLVTQLYQNIDNVFTAADVELPGVENGAIEFADYDNDGDLDIFLAGDGVSSTITTMLENNYPDNSFTNKQPGLTAVNSCNVSWGDYDGDGDLDLAYSGRSLGLGGITKIYENDTTNGFIDVSFDLSEFNDANMAWGDYDDDDDLDLVITGQASSGEGSIFKVYKNVITFQDDPNLKSYGLKAVDRPKNKPPNVPSRLKSSQGDSPTNIRFTWDPSDDDNTSSPGLTYALRIGTTSGGSEIMSANAIADGTRKLSGKGNVEHNLSWNVDLKPGKYYWSVQAIDAAYSGSSFSEEQVLIISGTGIEANNAPTNIDISNDRLPGDSPIGTLLGNIYTEDPDNLDAHVYRFIDSIGGEDNNAFEIINESIYTTTNFDFNIQNTFYILIEAVDQGGLTYTKPFVIYIDTALSVISYAPHKINIDNTSVNERSPFRTLVGYLTAEDVNPDDNHTFRLVEGEADNDQFIIEYDDQSSYEILVEVMDGDSLTYEESFTIYIISSYINYAPTNISLNAFDLYESSPAGTVAGVLSADDSNVDDDHTFRLVDGIGSG